LVSPFCSASPVVHASRLRHARGFYALRFIPAAKMLARMNETFDATPPRTLRSLTGEAAIPRRRGHTDRVGRPARILRSRADRASGDRHMAALLSRIANVGFALVMRRYATAEGPTRHDRSDIVGDVRRLRPCLSLGEPPMETHAPRMTCEGSMLVPDVTNCFWLPGANVR